jgi:hypothetical protein
LVAVRAGALESIGASDDALVVTVERCVVVVSTCIFGLAIVLTSALLELTGAVVDRSVVDALVGAASDELTSSGVSDVLIAVLAVLVLGESASCVV